MFMGTPAGCCWLVSLRFIRPWRFCYSLTRYSTGGRRINYREFWVARYLLSWLDMAMLDRRMVTMMVVMCVFICCCARVRGTPDVTLIGYECVGIASASGMEFVTGRSLGRNV
ncbi:hypothetical protein MLD38_012308 [Melastoma candidum]|uniref:Uncharacterized protein n=1 Tax=Melastoma candidum TaxID=119954 RepID=A0ACB9R780_9MYRT|nr:hypothetical protein MLD38_012308 [Melastoma candidum]